MRATQRVAVEESIRSDRQALSRPFSQRDLSSQDTNMVENY